MDKLKETLAEEITTNTKVYNSTGLDYLVVHNEPRKTWDEIEAPGAFLAPPPKRIAYLIHPPTGYNVAVYEPIGWFKRMMIKWCFGLKYEKI